MKYEFIRRLKSTLFGADSSRGDNFKSVCFDHSWYVNSYSDRLQGMDPLRHYIEIGAAEGLDPSEFFWTRWYLNQNPDVAQDGMNPLLHYELFGFQEGRAPCPKFDGRWYRDSYGLSEDDNPLAHFTRVGKAKGYLTSEPLWRSAFMSGERGANDHLFSLSLLHRLRSPRGEAYFSGPLYDGRAVIESSGRICGSFDELSSIAASMREHGAYCIQPYFTEFRDAFVLPGSTILIADNRIICDEIVASKAISPQLTQQKHWDRVWLRDDTLAFKYNVQVTPRISAGLHMFKEHEQNYFHFVCELLPKLFLLEKNRAVDVSIPLLISDDLADNLYEAMQAIKHPDRKVLRLKRNVPYAVDRLLFLSDVANVTDVYIAEPTDRHTFLPIPVLAQMAGKIKGSVDVTVNKRRKIFIPRRGKMRCIKNERAIAELLIKEGFEILDIESLSFKAQVNVFASADFVVAGTGAALTNLLWCSKGTRVVIFSSDHPYKNSTFWKQIGDGLDLNVSFLSGPRSFDVDGLYSVHDNYSIDEMKLLQVLN
jgi:hypothetical protein